MSTPTSFFFYCLHTPKRNAGKVYQLKIMLLCLNVGKFIQIYVCFYKLNMYKICTIPRKFCTLLFFLAWLFTVIKLMFFAICYFSATCLHKPASRFFTDQTQPRSLWIWPLMAAVPKTDPSHWRTELWTWLCPVTWLLRVSHDAIREGIMVDYYTDPDGVVLPWGADEILSWAAVTFCDHTTACEWWKCWCDVCGYRALSCKFLSHMVQSNLPEQPSFESSHIS